MFWQYERLSNRRFEHPLPTFAKLASVMFSQPVRSSDWRFEHCFTTFNKLASVMFLQPQRLSDCSSENLPSLSPNMINISSFSILVGSCSSFTPEVPSHSSQRELGVLVIRQYNFEPSSPPISHTIGSWYPWKIFSSAATISLHVSKRRNVWCTEAKEVMLWTIFLRRTLFLFLKKKISVSVRPLLPPPSPSLLSVFCSMSLLIRCATVGSFFLILIFMDDRQNCKILN